MKTLPLSYPAIDLAARRPTASEDASKLLLAERSLLAMADSLAGPLAGPLTKLAGLLAEAWVDQQIADNVQKSRQILTMWLLRRR